MPPKRLIQDKNYIFEIISHNGATEFCFFIRAIYKSTGRFSCINNLNTILSELGLGDNEKYNDNRFHKYHGIRKKNYPLYVKEREFRFNYREANLYPLLVEVFKQFGMKLH